MNESATPDLMDLFFIHYQISAAFPPVVLTWLNLCSFPPFCFDSVESLILAFPYKSALGFWV